VARYNLLNNLLTGTLYLLSGDDNSEDPQCSDESVPTILNGNVLDHVCSVSRLDMRRILCLTV